MQPSEWQRAYVLHRRPYRSTSYIMDVWTEKSGRISLVAKSARGLKSRFRGQLEPFTPLLITWRGRSELKNLTQAEVAGMPCDLQGSAMWCGFYMNELLIRLFRPESPYPVIFQQYEKALKALSGSDLQSPLRHFECCLLQELGYAISFSHDVHGNPILAEQHYRFFPEKGFECCEESEDNFVFSGAVLLALHHQQPIEEPLRMQAKRLLRISLHPHLGNKPLKSREFFVAQL